MAEALQSKTYDIIKSKKKYESVIAVVQQNSFKYVLNLLLKRRILTDDLTLLTANCFKIQCGVWMVDFLI